MKLVLIPWCITGVLFTSGCSPKTSTTVPELVADSTNSQTKTNELAVFIPKTHLVTETNSASATNISAGAEPILEYPTMRPLAEWLAALKPEDKMLLLSRYRSEAQLTNKLALTVALGFIGDEAVVEELKKTILRTRSEHVLGPQEREVMLSTVEGLGVLARRYDSAFQFLTNAVDPRFWRNTVPWQAESGHHMLAGRAIVAISFSQRPFVADVLKRLRQNPFIGNEGGGWFLGEYLVDAAFWHDLLTNRGFDYMKRIYGTEQIGREFRSWTQTENGREWHEWWKQWEKDHPKEAGLLPPQ